MSNYAPPTWSHSPSSSSSNESTTWSIEEIKNGCIITSHPLSTPCITFGRAADTVTIPTAHESCSRLHARIAFDKSGMPWLKDLGSSHGTFVNKRRLPPEACGKMEDNSGKKGSRGVVIYPGDVISFGASSRMYCVEGPVEFDRGNVKARMAAAAAAKTPEQPETSQEKSKVEKEEEGVSWGIDMNDANDNSDTDHSSTERQSKPSIPLDSTQIPTKHLKLYQKLQTKQYKLQNLQTESKRISAKSMSMELTAGQLAQLEKNKEKEEKLAQEVEELEEELRLKISGKDIAKQSISKRKREEVYEEEDDVDDFYDRTKKQSKQDIPTYNKEEEEEEEAETQESLTLQWKSLLTQFSSLSSQMNKAQIKVQHMEAKIASQRDLGGDEDLFFLQNDLQIANENLSKLESKQKSIEEEVEKVEKLLKIVNEKLVFDRQIQFVGLEADRPISTKVEETSMPPPPPPGFVKKKVEEMPPPLPASSSRSQPTISKNGKINESVTTAANTTDMPAPPTLPKKRILGPSMPPPPSTQQQTPQDTTNSNQSSMPAPSTTTIRKPRGPNRPPSSTLGALAALQSHATSTKKEDTKKATPASNASTKNTAPSAANNFIDAEAAKKDEWRAPKGQDGSGRTKLNDKFAGRY